MSAATPEVSVLIPARNEVATVGEVIDRALAALADPSEIIVVDDGSADGTAEVVLDRAAADPRVRLLRRASSGGKGTALRVGLASCRGRYVILQDADLELDPAAYPVLLAPLRSGLAAFVNGSRFMSGRGAAPRKTAIANRLLTLAGNIVFGVHLTDLCSGHKAFDARLFESVALRSKRYEVESELVGLAVRRGAPMLEVPTSYRPRTRQEGKRIGARDGLAILRMIVATRLRRGLPRWAE